MIPRILYTYTNQTIYIYEYEMVDGEITEVTITPDEDLAYVFTDMELILKIRKHCKVVLKYAIAPAPRVWFNLV